MENQETAATPQPIQRFGFNDGTEGPYDLVPHTDGAYVRYDDHIRALLNPLGQPLTRDDASTMLLLQMLLDQIADLEQTPTFAGFQFQRAMKGDELQFIRLMPCDKIGDVTVPRYAEPTDNRIMRAAVNKTLLVA